MKKIVAYCRVSGRGQLEGDGFDRQFDRIKRYCVDNGYQIEKVYKEQVSGTKEETERLVFTEMVEDIRKSGTKTVIVESLDRLARRYMVQEGLVIFLSAQGIDLINARSGENISEAFRDDPLRLMLIQLQGVVAEYNKSDLVRRLKKGRQSKKTKTGHCEGAFPYGSTDEEKEVLKRIGYFRRLQKGQHKRTTYQEIADKLNAEGIPTEKGRKMDVTSCPLCPQERQITWIRDDRPRFTKRPILQSPMF